MMQTENRNRLSEREGFNGDHRSLVDLLKELRDETLLLFRQEVDLAKTEMSEKASRAGRNVGYLAAGGIVAAMGALILLLGVVVGLYVALTEAGLSHATAGWLAPLIVGGIVAVIGYGLIQKSITTLKQESLALERTKASLIADKNWIQEKVH